MANEIGVEDTYVVIVYGDGACAETFRHSCLKLKRTLRNPRFLGLSADNVCVNAASSEKKVYVRLLALKLLLEDKVIHETCTRLLKACEFPDGRNLDRMRKWIAAVCTRAWVRFATERYRRRIVFSKDKVSREKSWDRTIFQLALNRTKVLPIDWTQSEKMATAMNKAEKAWAMFHLWKDDADVSILSDVRETERMALDNLVEKLKQNQYRYSAKDLGREVDECFRLLISTSSLPVSSETLSDSDLGADEPWILETEKINNKPERLLQYIIESLQPLHKGLLWYYYCGHATGHGDDKLDDKVLPKALLEATGQLVANMIVTLDCSHADANLPNIAHFVGNGPVRSSYTALTSCTARQEANHGTSQAFTEFLIYGLRSAIGNCRSVFRRCFADIVCSNRNCDACTAFRLHRQSQIKGPCETCIKFRSSSSGSRPLAEIFAYVKAHLCQYRMYPLFRQSGSERIHSIVKIYKQSGTPTSPVHTPEHTLDLQVKTADCNLSPVIKAQLEILSDVPSITSGCMNASVIIVSGKGDGAKVFKSCCEKLRDTLMDRQFVGISQENVFFSESTSEREVALRLLSHLLRLEDKVINLALSHTSKILGKPSDCSDTLRKIVCVCKMVRKRLALRRCLGRNTFPNRAALVPGLSSSTFEHLLQTFFQMAWNRFEILTEGKAMSASERAKTMLTSFYLWNKDANKNYLPSVRSHEEKKLRTLAKYITDEFKIDLRLDALGTEIDKCFRELVTTPFLPVSIEAVSIDDFVSDDSAKKLFCGYDISLICDVIVDSLRPLSDELLWYHYCGHSIDYLDDNVLPKALLEATGRLTAHMIVTLDCCHAEASIPDIAHFTYDGLSSSFSVLASCTVRQQSYYAKLPIFTHYFICGLKSAVDDCREAVNSYYLGLCDGEKHCGACNILREKESPCEPCRKFCSPGKTFHTLADIFHFVKAHLCSKSMYPVMRRSENSCGVAVAKAYLNTPAFERRSDVGEPSEAKKPVSKIDNSPLHVFKIKIQRHSGSYTEDQQGTRLMEENEFKYVTERTFHEVLAKLQTYLLCTKYCTKWRDTGANTAEVQLQLIEGGRFFKNRAQESFIRIYLRYEDPLAN